MAKLLRDPAPGRFEFFTPLKDYLKASVDDLDRYLDESEAAMARGQIEGFVLMFPIADGKAFYRVIKEKPLTLQHIPFGDAYEIPAAHIRGLTMVDIKREMKFQKGMKELFSQKEAPV